jgi:hypothetical protein
MHLYHSLPEIIAMMNIKKISKSTHILIDILKRPSAFIFCWKNNSVLYQTKHFNIFFLKKVHHITVKPSSEQRLESYFSA